MIVTLSVLLLMLWVLQRNTPADRETAVMRTSAADVQEDPAVHTCNLCGATARFTEFNNRPEATCPNCKSRERHRLLMHYMRNETRLFHDKLDMLHFSPIGPEKDILRNAPNLHYVTADYSQGEDLRLDLTSVEQPDASWDVIVAYHVLEHIVEDQKAIHEMYRILRPGGQAILQVPLEPGRKTIYEDTAIVSPKERARHFGGHADHVRLYSAGGFKQRLEAAGFVVEAVDYVARLDPSVVERHAMRSKAKKPDIEDIWIARKPAR